MRILLLSSKFPYPLKDGGAIATYQLFRGLKEFANQLFLLSFNTSKHFINIQEIPAHLFPSDLYKLVNINTKPSVFAVLFNLLFTNKPYILKRFKSRFFSKELKGLLKSTKFDIIQIEGLYMMQYIADIRKNSDAKIVYRAHNIEHQIWEKLAGENQRGFKNKYYKILSNRVMQYEKSIINQYDILLPIANEDAEFFRQSGNIKPVKIIQTGFDFIEDGEYINQIEQHRLFFIGSLEWRPNQEAVLWFINNCWKKIRDQFPDLNFYIAGRNAPDWLKRQFKTPGIVWEGEVENASDFMKNKSVMIVPLQSGSGLRIKIVEAFKNRKAVVASSVAIGGTGAINGRHLFVANHPDDFVEKIVQLINDRRLYNSLIINAYQHVKQNFNNQTINRELFAFYSEQLI